MGDNVSVPPHPSSKAGGGMPTPGRMPLKKRSETEGQATLTYGGDHIINAHPKIMEHLSNCILQTKLMKMHIHTQFFTQQFFF